MKTKTYKLSPDVVVRFIECLQQAMLFQQDIGMLLAEMELQESESDGEILDLTPEYKDRMRQQVIEMEKQLVRQSQEESGIIFGLVDDETSGQKII